MRNANIPMELHWTALGERLRAAAPEAFDSDREEHFGGIGKSWRGAFVGGEHLVKAVTTGPEGSTVYGNFEAPPQLSVA